MRDLLVTIGSVIFTAFLFCLPVLLTCAFCLDWSRLVKLGLITLNVIEFLIVTAVINLSVE